MSRAVPHSACCTRFHGDDALANTDLAAGRGVHARRNAACSQRCCAGASTRRSPQAPAGCSTRSPPSGSLPAQQLRGRGRDGAGIRRLAAPRGGRRCPPFAVARNRRATDDRLGAGHCCELIQERKRGAAPEPLAAALHDGLSTAIVDVARRVGRRRVVLTGGCFQNARLTERTVDLLCAAGFAPYFHHRIPPNDGGLAIGQAVFAARPLIEEKR